MSDNLQLRSKQEEIATVATEIAVHKEKLGDFDVTGLNRQEKELHAQQEKLRGEVSEILLFEHKTQRFIYTLWFAVWTHIYIILV